MKRFKLGQRVRVLLDIERRQVNALGTVARLRRSDDAAWIALDARHARVELHPFPANDERGTHVLAAPSGCWPVPAPVHEPLHYGVKKELC